MAALSIEAIAAVTFAVVTAAVIGFQLALAAGAPLGEYAMGGAYPGKYPPRMRAVAVIQAAVLAAGALAILSAGGVLTAPWGMTPQWVEWAIVVLLVLGIVLNLITPSRRERRVWAPVVAVMLACSLIVALSG